MVDRIQGSGVRSLVIGSLTSPIIPRSVEPFSLSHLSSSSCLFLPLVYSFTSSGSFPSSLTTLVNSSLQAHECERDVVREGNEPRSWVWWRTKGQDPRVQFLPYCLPSVVHPFASPCSTHSTTDCTLVIFISEGNEQAHECENRTSGERREWATVLGSVVQWLISTLISKSYKGNPTACLTFQNLQRTGCEMEEEWKVWETGRLVRSLMLAHFTLFRSPPLVHSLIEWNHHERNVGAEWWVRSLARLRSVHSPTVHSCPYLRTLLLIPKRREQRELNGGTIWEGEGKRGDRTVGRELNQPWVMVHSPGSAHHCHPAFSSLRSPPLCSNGSLRF